MTKKKKEIFYKKKDHKEMTNIKRIYEMTSRFIVFEF